MKELQKATQNVFSSASDQEKMDSLSKAFEIFSYETVKLENAYDGLGEQFQSLNLELQDTNHKLHSKVAELDVITDYLKNILDNIAQGILFIDPQGMIMTYNSAAEEILGIKSPEVLYHRFWDVFKDEAFGFSMRTALEKKIKKMTHHASYLSPSNHPSELEIVTSFTLKEPQKARFQHQGLIVMIRDVTEMRQLQTTAARGDRLKVLGEMAAQVAHEIRNPLGGIKGFASLLKRDLADHPELEKMAGYIVEGTDSLNQLVSQILHYARPVHPHFEKTDLSDLLHQIKQHILADANYNHSSINIEIKAPIEPILLSLDSSLIKSALLNLVVNAIQAMPNGGTITLTLKNTPGFITLTIADTGVGIPEEHLSKLYSPFFTTKPEGNGLGLVEVQKVIQAHNGTIDVISILDKGTTFLIKLPSS